MTYALVFPGQGAQVIGMGQDFYATYAVARDVFEEADAALDFPLSRIIFEGPEDELTKTSVTQPAVLTVSIAILKVLEEEIGESLKPDFVAGHSLGEYTALVASGCLDFSNAVRLVHKRGQWMQQAVPLGAGSMSAIMGLDMGVLQDVCMQASQGDSICQPANVNAPTQIVISGAADAVSRAGDIAKERGASKVIPLKVSAPFHSFLMNPVAIQLEEVFKTLTWKDPKFPVVANVDGQAQATAEGIREALMRQTYSPVLWVDDVLFMERAGVDTFIELGPGNTLCGLIKRISKGRKLCALNKVPELSKAMDLVRGIL